MPLVNLSHAAVLVDGLDHPEGVTWGPDGMLYAGGEAGQLYRIDSAAGTATEIGNTGGLNLGLALDGAGSIYVCSPGAGGVIRVTAQGAVSPFTRGNNTRTMITPNYPAFDPAGHLYVADSGTWKADNGCIWSVAPDGTTTVIEETECVHFPNGCAVSPDGTYLYVAMSLNPPRVVRFPIAGGRKVGPVETVVTLPHTVPDGLAFCHDGSFLVSCYRPDTIFHVQANGDVGVVMDDYEGTLLGAPTNVCFGGPDLSLLFWANLGRWHIGVNRRTGLRGSPLFYPAA